MATALLACSVTALPLRAAERSSGYHENLHDFAEQTERLLIMVVLVCFGAAIAEGSIFHPLNWNIIIAALIIIYVVRALAGWLGLSGSPITVKERAVISFFGIRGLGSIYYVPYAVGHANFERADVLWATVSPVILIFLILHGVAVTTVMRYLERT